LTRSVLVRLTRSWDTFSPVVVRERSGSGRARNIRMHLLFSLWNRYEQRLGAWASIFGVAVVVIGRLASANIADSTQAVIYAAGLTLVLVGSATTFLLMSVQLSRRSRHAEAIANVRESVHKIATENLTDSHSLDEKKRVLSCAMDDLSKAFSVVTGSNCRCCVKTVQVQEGKLYAQTFCRNSDYTGQDTPHPIEHNTDFNDLFQDKGRRWFFGNNLPELAKAGGYLNTSKDWQTRYRSTLIWPIRCERSGDAEAPDLLGFLCVDSKRTRAFSEEYDHPLGAIVADTLCPFMMRIAKSTKDVPLQAKDMISPATTPAAQLLPPPEAKPLAWMPTEGKLANKSACRRLYSSVESRLTALSVVKN
jgi:hypothetical protein